MSSYNKYKKPLKFRKLTGLRKNKGDMFIAHTHVIDSLEAKMNDPKNRKEDTLYKVLKQVISHYTQGTPHSSRFYYNDKMNKSFQEIVDMQTNMTILIKAGTGVGKSTIALSTAESIMNTLHKGGFESRIHTYFDLDEFNQDIGSIKDNSVIIMDESVRQSGDDSINFERSFANIVDRLRANRVSIINCTPSDKNYLKENKYTLQPIFVAKKQRQNISLVYSKKISVENSSLNKYVLTGYYISEFPTQDRYDKYEVHKMEMNEEVLQKGGLAVNSNLHLIPEADELHKVVKGLLISKQIKSVPQTKDDYKVIYEVYMNKKASFTSNQFNFIKSYIKVKHGGYRKKDTKEKVKKAIKSNTGAVQENQNVIDNTFKLVKGKYMITYERYKRYEEEAKNMTQAYINRFEIKNEKSEELYRLYEIEKVNIMDNLPNSLAGKKLVKYKMQQEQGFSNPKISELTHTTLSSVSTDISRVKGHIVQALGHYMEDVIRTELRENPDIKVSFSRAFTGIADVLSFNKKYSCYDIVSLKIINGGSRATIDIKKIDPEYRLYQNMKNKGIRANLYLQYISFDELNKVATNNRKCLNGIDPDWKVEIK